MRNRKILGVLIILLLILAVALIACQKTDKVPDNNQDKVTISEPKKNNNPDTSEQVIPEKESKFALSYVMNDGTNSEDNPVEYLARDCPIKLSNPTRRGYIFCGWKLNSVYVTEITEASKEPIVLVADWVYGTNGLKFAKSGEEYTVSGYDGSVADIIIPSSYRNLPVTSIGNDTFKEINPNSISIPQSVVHMSNKVFSDDVASKSSPTTVYCAAKVKPEGWDETWHGGRPVVWDCKSKVTMDNGLIYCINSINQLIILGYIGSESEIEIPHTINHNNVDYSVSEIAARAFSYSWNLESIIISDRITAMGESAFDGWWSEQTIKIAGTNYTSWDEDWKKRL